MSCAPDTMKLFTSVVFFLETHNPSLIIRKCQTCEEKLRDILQNTLQDCQGLE